MAIPSLTKWKTMTVTDSIGGRSPEMGMIDDQIRAFTAARGDQAGENKAAYAIRKACRHWQTAPVTNPVTRRAVTWLEGEAESHLAANQAGWTQFAAAKTPGRGANLKALAPGYAHERRQFLNEGKQQNPVSASALRDTALADALPGTNAHTLISQMDDVTWDGYARPGGVMRSGGAMNEVLFFDKRERLEHMLVVTNGLLLWAKDNSPCTTPAGQPFMYAMDGYGNLFARADNLGASQFNHSSFNAGREVVCAGMIGVAAGLVHFISNESGHYQPDRGALFSCVQKLRQKGARLVFPRVAGWRRPTDPAEARTRVRVLGVGDWPADSYPGTEGFDQVAAALAHAPPAPIPNPPVYGPWQ